MGELAIDPRIRTARRWLELTGRIPRAYRTALKEMRYDDRVLDFGAGFGEGAKWMWENAPVEIESVTKYDLNPEWSENPSGTYDLIVASNVLNIQDSMKQLKATINRIAEFTNEQTTIVASYPKEPRRLDLHFNSVKAILNYTFIKNRVVLV